MSRYIQISCILLLLAILMGCSKEVEELTNNSQTINHPTESETNQQSKSNSNLLSAEEAMNKLQSIMSREIEIPLWLSDVELEGDMYNITLFQEISNGSTRAITKFYIDRKSSVIYYDNWNNGKREKITNFQVPDSYFHMRMVYTLLQKRLRLIPSFKQK